MKKYNRLCEAFSTPWGIADYAKKLATGIIWVGTPSHGGLMISKGLAKKILTASAIKVSAMSYGNYYCFEEDAAWCVAAYDSNEVLNALATGYMKTTPEDLRQSCERSINQYYPEYFKYIQQGLKHKEKLKVGDMIRFNNDEIWWSVWKPKKGDTALITKITSSSIIVDNRFRFSLSYYENGDVEKADITESSSQINKKRKIKESEEMYKGDDYYKKLFDDPIAAYEIELSIENDGDLYRGMFQSIIKNIKQKIKTGRYNHSLAPKLWMYYVEAGLKSYAKNYGGKWNELLNTKDRKVLAQKFADQVYDSIQTGEY